MPTYRQSQYRWTKQLFDDDLWRFPYTWHKKKLVKAFGQYSGLRGPELTAAFQPGGIPLVKVDDVQPSLYGWTPPGSSDVVHINRTFVEELESVLPANRVPRGPTYAPTELETKLLLILEATILHEMVHFFRKKFSEETRIRMMSVKGLNYEEHIADTFEREAYGMNPDIKTLAILKYLPRTAAQLHPRVTGE